MDWVLLLLAIMGAWALLTVIGGEREQRLQDITARVLEAQRKMKSEQ